MRLRCRSYRRRLAGAFDLIVPMSRAAFDTAGEEIRKGDRIRYHEDLGEVEFVADRLSGDPESDWYVTEYGGGVGLLVPGSFGRVLLTSTDDDED